MSNESKANVLPTVALLVAVLAGITTILGYFGWHPRWEQTAPSAEPAKAELPRAEPPKAEPPKAEPPKAEPPKAEPLKSPPPKAEPLKSPPPKSPPPTSTTMSSGEGALAEPPRGGATAEPASALPSSTPVAPAASVAPKAGSEPPTERSRKRHRHP
jgi:hypothetical protein